MSTIANITKKSAVMPLINTGTQLTMDEIRHSQGTEGQE